MFEVGQEVKLTHRFSIEDENEEPTGDILNIGTVGVISEILDYGVDWVDYLVSFEPYGLFEITHSVLEPAE